MCWLVVGNFFSLLSGWVLLFFRWHRCTFLVLPFFRSTSLYMFVFSNYISWRKMWAIRVCASAEPCIIFVSPCLPQTYSCYEVDVKCYNCGCYIRGTCDVELGTRDSGQGRLTSGNKTFKFLVVRVFFYIYRFVHPRDELSVSRRSVRVECSDFFLFYLFGIFYLTEFQIKCCSVFGSWVLDNLQGPMNYVECILCEFIRYEKKMG